MIDVLNYEVVAYGIFLLVFLIYSVAAIYHLWRFGYAGDLSKLMIFIYCAFVLAVIIASLFLISLNMGIK